MKRYTWSKVAILILMLVIIVCIVSACSLFDREIKVEVKLYLDNNNHSITEKEVDIGSSVTLYVDGTRNSVLFNVKFQDLQFKFIKNDCQAEISVGNNSAVITTMNSGTVTFKAISNTAKKLLVKAIR